MCELLDASKAVFEDLHIQTDDYLARENFELKQRLDVSERKNKIYGASLEHISGLNLNEIKIYKAHARNLEKTRCKRISFLQTNKFCFGT